MAIAPLNQTAQRGDEKFVFLSPKEGIYIPHGPEDYYEYLRKN